MRVLARLAECPFLAAIVTQTLEKMNCLSGVPVPSTVSGSPLSGGREGEISLQNNLILLSQPTTYMYLHDTGGVYKISSQRLIRDLSEEQPEIVASPSPYSSYPRVQYKSLN